MLLAIRDIAAMVMTMRRDLTALEIALLKSGTLDVGQISSARAEYEKRLGVASRRIDEDAHTRNLAALLEQFEGPKQ